MNSNLLKVAMCLMLVGGAVNIQNVESMEDKPQYDDNRSVYSVMPGFTVNNRNTIYQNSKKLTREPIFLDDQNYKLDDDTISQATGMIMTPVPVKKADYNVISAHENKNLQYEEEVQDPYRSYRLNYNFDIERFESALSHIGEDQVEHITLEELEEKMEKYLKNDESRSNQKADLQQNQVEQYNKMLEAFKIKCSELQTKMKELGFKFVLKGYTDQKTGKHSMKESMELNKKHATNLVNKNRELKKAWDEYEAEYPQLQIDKSKIDAKYKELTETNKILHDTKYKSNYKYMKEAFDRADATMSDFYNTWLEKYLRKKNMILTKLEQGRKELDNLANNYKNNDQKNSINIQKAQDLLALSDEFARANIQLAINRYEKNKVQLQIDYNSDKTSYNKQMESLQAILHEEYEPVDQLIEKYYNTYYNRVIQLKNTKEYYFVDKNNRLQQEKLKLAQRVALKKTKYNEKNSNIINIKNGNNNNLESENIRININNDNNNNPKGNVYEPNLNKLLLSNTNSNYTNESQINDSNKNEAENETETVVQVSEPKSYDNETAGNIQETKDEKKEENLETEEINETNEIKDLDN